MSKIIFSGPESSGKSYLAKYSSLYFDLPLVEEQARQYLTYLDRKYRYEDLTVIAKLQLMEEYKQAHSSVILCDTDVLTIIIWAEEKFQKIPSWIMNVFLSQKERHYLLCRPDIPWQADSQRENPLDRDRLFEIYLRYLEKFNKSYSIVSGDFYARKKLTKNIISTMLS